MRLPTEVVFPFLLLATCRGAPQQFKRKSTEGLKRAVETYSYPAPTERFGESQGNLNSRVIVETIKSISPSEYLTSSEYLGSTIEGSAANGKIPVGTITFNAFEPDTTKKATTVNFISTETAVPAKKKSNYKYYTGSITSSSQKPTNSAAQISSTIQPAPVRTTGVEPVTTFLPGHQYTSHSSNFPQSSASGEVITAEKPLKVIGSRRKPNNGRYSLRKISKKQAKVEPKLSDSKPEETGFNGYHYDVGSLSFESKPSGSQGGGGGMMGASYMRSSSPFYNYHVMLD